MASRPVTATTTKSLMLPYFGAHLGKSLLWYASEAFIAFLLTEIIRLPVSSIGWALGIGFIVSAILDVVIGARLRDRLADPLRSGRLQVVGSVVSASALAILFAVPLFSTSSSYLLVVLTVAVFRVAYAFVDIPQNAILSTSTRDDPARARLASARLAGSGLAALAVSVMVSVIIYHASATRPALILGAAAIIATVAIVSSMVLEHALVRSHVVTAMSGAAGPPSSRRLPKGVFLLLAAMSLTSFAAPVFTKLLPYYAAYRLPGLALGGGTIAAVSLGMVIGQPLLMAGLRRATPMGRISLTSLATSTSALLFAAVGAGGTWTIPAAAWLFGACSASLGAALWAAYADVVAGTMFGREGLAFGLLTASAKVSLAVSGVGIGWLLSDASFRSSRNGILLYGMTMPEIMAGLAIAMLLAASSRPSRFGQISAPR